MHRVSVRYFCDVSSAVYIVLLQTLFIVIIIIPLNQEPNNNYVDDMCFVKERLLSWQIW